MSTEVDGLRPVNYAIAYAHRGYRVFPVHWIYPDGKCSCRKPDCGSPGKHPIEKGWQASATTDEQTIIRWWSRNPEANIGIATGKASNLTVLDVDVPKPNKPSTEDGRDTLHEMQAKYSAIPETPIVITGSGGPHYYFQYQPEIRNEVRFAPGLDTRNGGGFVVGAGSKNEYGEYYWDASARLGDLRPAKMPDWLVEQIVTTTRSNNGAGVKLPDKIHEGEGRNNALWKVGRGLKAKNLPEAAIREGLRAANQSVCKPPMSSSEIDKLIENVLKQPDRGAAWVRRRAPAVTDIDATVGTQVEQKEIAISSRILADHQRDIKWGKLGWLNWDGQRLALVDESQIIGLAEQTTRRIYIEMANARSKEEFEYLSDLAKTGSQAARIRGALDFVKSHVTVSVDHPYNELDIHPELINFKNGTYDVTTGDLRPHDRADLLTKLIPFDYNPQAKAPRFHRFLDEIFEYDETKKKFVKQYAGYSFTGYQDEKSFIYLYGSLGNNGKTRLVEILLMAAGEYGQAAPESLFVATKHEQHTTEQARLRGMRFVAVSETSQGGKFNEARIRRMTGDDLITARFMHKDFFDFKQTHHPWFLSNYKLQISGRDEAIWSRPKLIEFPVQFVDPTPECPEPKHRKDHTLKAQLELEIEGVLAWVIEGAREWYERRKQNLGIQEPQCVRDAVAKYRQDEDQLQHFLDECLEARDATPAGARTPKSLMYAASRVWCRLCGLEPWSIKMLGILLDEAGLKDGREDSARYWEDVALKKNWERQAFDEIERLKEAKTGPRG